MAGIFRGALKTDDAVHNRVLRIYYHEGLLQLANIFING